MRISDRTMIIIPITIMALVALVGLVSSCSTSPPAQNEYQPDPGYGYQEEAQAQAEAENPKPDIVCDRAPTRRYSYFTRCIDRELGFVCYYRLDTGMSCLPIPVKP